MPKSTGTACNFFKIIHHIKHGLDDGNKNYLSEAIPRIDRKKFYPAIPIREKYLSVTIGIDQSGQRSNS